MRENLGFHVAQSVGGWNGVGGVCGGLGKGLPRWFPPDAGTIMTNVDVLYVFPKQPCDDRRTRLKPFLNIAKQRRHTCF